MLNQLQELDKQISDLRLDVEKTSEEHLETDSRPSSGECVSTRTEFCTQVLLQPPWV